MRPALRQLLAAALARSAPASSEPPPVAVDFETFYRTARRAQKQNLSPCTAEDQGNWAYCRHPEWSAYLVALYSPAHPALDLPAIEYVGPPASAPWESLRGRTWLSHHRNFDRHAYERLVEQALVPAIPYPVWHDTADLAAYCHLPRALGKIASLHFRLTLDKAARAEMDGVAWPTLEAPAQERLLHYALEDAALCLLLWLDLAPRWPEWERRLSLHTGQLEFRGVPIDRPRLERHLGWLETALWQTRRRIPWLDDQDELTGRPYALRSKRALDRECLACGVPPPETTDQKSKTFLDWLDRHGDRVPAIHQLARYRRIDRALATHRALLARLRPDGRAALGLKYLGAEKTGRWSGATKFNLQNIPKHPLAFAPATFAWLEWDSARAAYLDDTGAAYAPDQCHLVDLRACLTASPGRKLIIPDLSQIEPRVLNWLVGNHPFLDHCRRGLSPYEAHAIASMGYTPKPAPTAASPQADSPISDLQTPISDNAAPADRIAPTYLATPPSTLPLKKENPALYALAKARLLALGYGAGWQKFIEMARGYLDSEELFLALFAAEPAPRDTQRFLAYLERSAQSPAATAAAEALAAWPDLAPATRHIWVNAWLQVTDFRVTNPLIAARADPASGTPDGLWHRLDRAFRAAAATDHGTYTLTLPSGRTLQYFSVTPQWGWSSRPGHPLAHPQRTYGGLLAENLCQAIARDAFAAGLLNLEAAGYDILFHVHDEVIIDAPADTDPAHCIQLLTTMPPWAATLPLDSAAEVSPHYKK